jgi:hypothetical protein
MCDCRTSTSLPANSEAEAFFLAQSAHSDVADELLTSLKPLGEYEVLYASGEYGAIFATTNGTVFCGAAGMNHTYWRLRPADYEVALATGAARAPIGPGWVTIELFRSDWPKPDLEFWALRAYDFARTGR